MQPKNTECFYLRMLIYETRGLTCFSDFLKKVDKYLSETYREACQRLGLRENDNHWTTAETAEQVNDLFAIILTKRG